MHNVKSKKPFLYTIMILTHYIIIKQKLNNIIPVLALPYWEKLDNWTISGFPPSPVVGGSQWPVWLWPPHGWSLLLPRLLYLGPGAGAGQGGALPGGGLRPPPRPVPRLGPAAPRPGQRGHGARAPRPLSGSWCGCWQCPFPAVFSWCTCLGWRSIAALLDFRLLLQVCLGLIHCQIGFWLPCVGSGTASGFCPK